MTVAMPKALHLLKILLIESYASMEGLIDIYIPKSSTRRRPSHWTQDVHSVQSLSELCMIHLAARQCMLLRDEDALRVTPTGPVMQRQELAWDGPISGTSSSNTIPTESSKLPSAHCACYRGPQDMASLTRVHCKKPTPEQTRDRR